MANGAARGTGQRLFGSMVWVGLAAVVLLWVGALFAWCASLAGFLRLPPIGHEQVLPGVGLGLVIACCLLWVGSATGSIALSRGLTRAIWGVLVLGMLGASVEGYRRLILKPPRAIGRAELVRELGWDWQHADRCWRVAARFDAVPGSGAVTFVGDVRYVCPRPAGATPQPTIARWTSRKPIPLPAEDITTIEFDAELAWTPAVAEVYPEMAWEVGKPARPARVRLKVGPALEGAALVSNGPHGDERWGVMLTLGYPR
jgi:hypothetical protein